MSTAHRPTWAPAQARDAGSGSRQVSSKDMAAHTKLKFRQPGQGTTNELQRRDLRLELEKAERAARNKRKGITEPTDEVEGVPKAGLIAGAPVGATQEKEDEQAAKRRKLLEQAAELDRDDSEEEEDDEEGKTPADKGTITNGKGKEKAVEQNDDDDDAEESSDEEDSDDDEDETAELLRELEKIKRERAEEKERQERERATSAVLSAEEAAATGNPLLNLQAALQGRSPSYASTPGGSSASGGSFQIRKRWDDDVIFKNQANKSDDPKPEFVNDLIRTQFHRRFLSKYIA